MSSPSQTPSAPPKSSAPTLPGDPTAWTLKALLETPAALLTTCEVLMVASGKIPYDPTLQDASVRAFRNYLAGIYKIYFPFDTAVLDNVGVDPDGTINGWAFPTMPTPKAPGGGGTPAGPSPLSLVTALLNAGSTALQGVDPATVAKLQALLGAASAAAQVATGAPTAPAQNLAGTAGS